MTDSEALPDALADLPPSAELVYVLVRDLEDPTQADLLTNSARPERTVRYALDRLEDEDLITKRHSLEDARQCVYETTPGREVSK